MSSLSGCPAHPPQGPLSKRLIVLLVRGSPSHGGCVVLSEINDLCISGHPLTLQPRLRHSPGRQMQGMGWLEDRSAGTVKVAEDGFTARRRRELFFFLNALSQNNCGASRIPRQSPSIDGFVLAFKTLHNLLSACISAPSYLLPVQDAHLAMSSRCCLTPSPCPCLHTFSSL